MRTQGAPTGPMAVARAVVTVGAIAAAVLVWGCGKKSESEAGAKQAEPAATAAQPAETAAAPEAKPAEAAPAEAKPAEAAPAESKSAEMAPAEAAPAETKPAEAKPAAAAPAQAAPFDPEHPYRIDADGKINFATYRGYNMYHSICFVCHGPDGRGSSFAPSLMESLKVLTYEDFITVVMNGRENITSVSNNVMPAFGESPSVVKYIDSLYAYLKARSDGALKGGTPEWTGAKE